MEVLWELLGERGRINIGESLQMNNSSSNFVLCPLFIHSLILPPFLPASLPSIQQPPHEVLHPSSFPRLSAYLYLAISVHIN